MSEREEKRYKLAWNEDKTEMLLVPDDNGDIVMDSLEYLSYVIDSSGVISASVNYKNINDI